MQRPLHAIHPLRPLHTLPPPPPVRHLVSPTPAPVAQHKARSVSSIINQHIQHTARDHKVVSKTPTGNTAAADSKGNGRLVNVEHKYPGPSPMVLSTSERRASLSPMHPQPQAFVVSDNLTTLKATSPVSTQEQLPWDPSRVFYKASIRVADRLAKGPGVVYLLTSFPKDTGTFVIYLEGIKYLEYPVSRLHNYIANSTELCPQFKEADNVSITTTALVFGSTDKMAGFMNAVKSLQNRNSSSGLLGVQSTTVQSSEGPAVSDTSSGVIPALGASQGQHDRVDSRLSKHGESKGAIAQIDAAPHASFEVVPSGSAPTLQDFRNDTSRQSKMVAAEMTSDLLDLSPIDGHDRGDYSAYSDRASTHAADLESLYFPPANSFGEASAALNASDNCSVLMLDYSDDDLPQMIPEDAVRLSGSTPAPSATSVPSCQDQVSSAGCAMDQTASLRDCFLDILPTFESIRMMLKAVNENGRVAAARAIFSNIPVEGTSEDKKCLSSAKNLLQTLLAQSPEQTLAIFMDALSPPRGPKYAPEEILCLRAQGIPPPDYMFRLEFLPLSTKKQKPQGHGLVQADPGDASKTITDNEELALRSVCSPAMQEKPPSVPSPTVLRSVSNSSSLVSSAMSGVPTPLQKTQGESNTKAGLMGSRWAPGENCVLPENTYCFTGVAMPN